MDGKNNGSFWPSYVDIMTTLFAIMLILFAVSFSRFKIKERQLQLLVNEYEDIIKVYSTVSSIDSTMYFDYNAQYLKHLFTVDVEYQQKEYRIDRLNLDQTDKLGADNKRDSILRAGEIVKETIMKLESSDSLKNNIKFLVVIEGQSSRVKYDNDDYHNNYTLSYLRAQFLNKFWKDNGIDLASIPRCELIISGSGEDGVPRVTSSIVIPKTIKESKQWIADESKNQRFLIHIVPVIGNIDVTKAKIESIKGK
ncbi:MAG: hypothetical protein J5905_01325 [Prevotella sp.]|nr:hypothetical protein [Prevotella sp.]